MPEAALVSILFLVALVLIGSEVIHRTIVAVTGGVLVVLLGIIHQEQAIEAVDFATIGLLVGMMVVVESSRETGAFDWFALKAAKWSGGRPIKLVLSMAFVTGILSAFLDNLTTILLVAPITLLIADTLGMRPVPLLIIEILASNIGGTATLIGDPPNIMIAGFTKLTFNQFLANLFVISFAILVVTVLILYAIFRKQFSIDPTRLVELDTLDPSRSLARGRELWVPLTILTGTIVAFFAHQALHLEPATVALAGAAAMLLFVASSPDHALDRVDWSTLAFFAGLFVMVGGLEHTGAIDSVAAWVQDVTDGNRTHELLGIAWVAAIGSGFVDNIPFTAAMIPVVDQISPGTVEGNSFTGDAAHWWALALGACLGGNLTIIAAAANVACQGIAERAGTPIRFGEFLVWGIITVAISMSMATVYLLVFYA